MIKYEIQVRAWNDEQDSNSLPYRSVDEGRVTCIVVGAECGAIVKAMMDEALAALRENQTATDAE